MTQPYRLHFAPDNASLVIRLALLELGQPFETVYVDRSVTAQRSDAYLAVNPVGRIPALETPHGPLFETAAILLWLSERHGALMPPPGDPARGAALSWLFFLSNTLHAELRMLFHARDHGPDLTDGLCAALTQSLKRHFALLDRLAEAGPAWLGAATPSILDLYLGPLLRWTALYPQGRTDWFRLRADYPALHALACGLETRACVTQAATDEGLGPAPFSAPILATPPFGSAT